MIILVKLETERKHIIILVELQIYTSIYVLTCNLNLINRTLYIACGLLIYYEIII